MNPEFPKPSPQESSQQLLWSSDQRQVFLTACQELRCERVVWDEFFHRFAQVYAMVFEANRHMNLTRITEPEEFLMRHGLDALTLLPWIPDKACVADVGSGAGFPAIPLALARPDIQVTAVEATQKKSGFIQSVGQALHLDDEDRLMVVSDRAEVVGHDPSHREHYDVVVARAVAPLPVLLELCLPLVKVGGVFLAMKGRSYETELEDSEKALTVCKGRLNTIRTFDTLPVLHQATLLVFGKTGPIPDAYPRKTGLPSKRPIF